MKRPAIVEEIMGFKGVVDLELLFIKWEGWGWLVERRRKYCVDEDGPGMRVSPRRLGLYPDLHLAL